MTTPAHPVVGLHDFLNSRPLLHPIRHGLVETPFTLVIDTPANLAARFAAGELDIALIPSIEYARIDDAVIIPDLCIASLGRVETVILFSDLAMEDIESVFCDPKSRSSVAMLQILFKELYGKQPAIIPGHDDLDHMLRDADSALIIGDTAFKVDRQKYLTHDLGELWYQYAGRPFVHAVMVAHKGAAWEGAIHALGEAKRIGMEHRELVAKESATEWLSVEGAYDYLTKRIIYDLNPEQIDGLSHFLTKAKQLGLSPRDELQFYHHTR
jgi:chorismate dehydratase